MLHKVHSKENQIERPRGGFLPREPVGKNSGVATGQKHGPGQLWSALLPRGLCTRRVYMPNRTLCSHAGQKPGSVRPPPQDGQQHPPTSQECKQIFQRRPTVWPARLDSHPRSRCSVNMRSRRRSMLHRRFGGSCGTGLTSDSNC